MSNKYYDKYGKETSKEQFDVNRRELLKKRFEEMKNPDNCVAYEDLDYYLDFFQRIKNV